MGSYHFICSKCEAKHDPDPRVLVCPACSAHQMKGGEVRGVLHVELEALPTPGRTGSQLPFESLPRFLPTIGPARRGLVVGGTPLLDVPRLAQELGLSRLWLKDDTRNPSGSTKDRASDLVVTKAIEFGFRTVAVASTGNAATALAATAAATDLEAVVFVPASAPEAKQVQMQSYGAQVIAIDGSYDQAFELCLDACEHWGWYNRNTALNPFTIEGKKTAALEIVAQMFPEAPDVVVVPTGDGVILAGVAKGFDDLLRAGWIRTRPRLIAVQPEGSSSIVRSLEEGRDSPEPFSGSSSVADSLVVDMPRNGTLCLSRIRQSAGSGVRVSDAEILSSIHSLARLTGVFAEPAAAAGLAGLRQAREKNLVDADERAVLLVTGTGLKDVPAAALGLEHKSPCPPTLDAVTERMKSWPRSPKS